MNNQECFLSIVVPVYNTEQYIKQCLNSLLDQDIEKKLYEIICVDDGSKDNSPQILDEYKQKYDNIIVIHQQNIGHAGARNTGLFQAKGKYVWFVDSDDIIDKDCIGFLIKTITETDADVFSIHYVPFHNDSELPNIQKNYYHPTNITKDMQGSTSGPKVFKKSILDDNKIIWNKELSPCDIEFCFYVGLYAKNYVYNHSVCYYHRQWGGSVTHTHNQEAYLKFNSSFFKLLSVYDKELKNPKWTKEQIENIISRKNLCVQTLLSSVAFKGDKKEADELLTYLKNNKLYPYRKEYYNLNKKINLKAQFLGFILYFINNEKFYYLFLNTIIALKKIKLLIK